jgi:hypothetical protein
VIWLTAGLLGAAITCANIYDSRKDRDLVNALRGDPAIHKTHWKMLAAAQADREESQWTRLAVCGLIIASGGVGVLQENPLRGATTWTGVIVTCTLVGVAALTAGRSLREYRSREGMYHLGLRRSSVTEARLKARNPPVETKP